MGDDMNQDRFWHIEKKIPVALIFSMALQTGGFIWWAARVDVRVDSLEARALASAPQVERIIRVETKLETVIENIGELKTLMRTRTQ